MAQNNPDIFDEFMMMIGELDGSMGTSKKLKNGEDTREPLVDISDNGKELIVVAELKGVIRDTISFKVDRRVLEIKADLQPSYFDGNSTTISRKISLPTNIDPKKISYSFTNGVIEVRMQKW